MGYYPEFYYDDEPCDPCEGCSDYVDGFCISCGGCGMPAMSQEEFENIREKLGVTDK